MHQDQKIGLSLAVLLIGFAGAFCFRHEPLLVPQPVALDRSAELDQRIEHLSIRAYTEREGAIPAADRPRPDFNVAPSGPLADVLEIGQLPRPASSAVDTASPDRIVLFAGPPEPLRITTDRIPASPSRSLTSSPPVESFPDSDPFPEPDDDAARTGSSANDSADRPLAPLTTPIAKLVPPGEVPPFETYQVRSGDTLSELAQRFLGSSRRYNELYEANRDVMSSPHALREGMRLKIPVEP